MVLACVVLLCLLVAQVTSGIKPSIRVEMTSHPLRQFAFHSFHIPKSNKISNEPEHLLKLEPSQLGLMFSHLLGLNPSQDLFWGGVTSVNPFSRPRAIALLTVEGLKEDVTLSLPQDTTSYQIQTDSSTADWLSGAFNPSLLRSRIVEMARGHNEPLMVSVAGDERLASAGPRGVKMMKRYYNSKTEGVSVISDYQHTELSKSQVLDAISVMNTDMLTVSRETNTVLLRQQDGSDVTFNLNYKADNKFFTEIMVAMDTLEGMQTRKETADNIPDLIAITFSALKDLRLKYGDSSPQVSAAIRLYSSLLPKLTNQIVSLYKGQVAVFGLTLIWSNPTGHKLAQPISDLYHLASSHLETQELEHFQLNFPEVILSDQSKETPSKFDYVCSLATEINSNTQLMHVSCPHRLRRFTILTNNNNNTNDTIDDNSCATERSAIFPYMFNIILLIVLIFIVTLFAISWSMWNLDPGMDSVIYRTTEPAKLKLE